MYGEGKRQRTAGEFCVSRRWKEERTSGKLGGSGDWKEERTSGKLGGIRYWKEQRTSVKLGGIRYWKEQRNSGKLGLFGGIRWYLEFGEILILIIFFVVVKTLDGLSPLTCVHSTKSRLNFTILAI